MKSGDVMSEKIVIVGCGAAGVSAALWARRTNKKAEIVVINREKFPEYSRCGLPYVIGQTVSEPESLISHPPSWYDKFLRIKLKLGYIAVDCDPDKKTLEVTNLKHEKVEKETYDKLIIATGSSPFIPPITGVGKKNVFTLRTLNDAIEIREAAKKSKEAVVVGAGMIGLEIAEALHHLGLKVTVVELLPQILPPVLDKDFAKIIQNKMEQHGITVLTGKRVEEIIGNGEVKGVIVEGEEIATDLVIVSTGVKPNTELAKKIGVELGKTGGIKTNEHMETNIENIYAAGDCAETKYLITNDTILPAMGTVAVRQGKVAGINAAGGKSTYHGTVLTRTTKLFGFEIASVGLTAQQAEKMGIKPVIGTIRGRTKPEYFPDSREIHIKIIANPKNDQIIGAQIIGEEGAAMRINTITLALIKKLTVDELLSLETVYAPPVAPVWDPLIIATDSVMKKLEKRRKKIQ